MKLSYIFIYSLVTILCASAALANPSAQKLAGKSCELWQDSQGITHVKATQDLHAVSCLGYLHGRDRAWQMDYFRKTAAGRKAEFFGYEAVAGDFFMRILDLSGTAKRIFSEMTPRDQEIYWSYTHGVNIGLKEALKNGVYEFKQFGYTPEQWQPEDSVALILLQSLDQTRRSFQNQIAEEKWRDKYPSTASQLFQGGALPWDTSILKMGEYPTKYQGEAQSIEVPKTSGSESVRAPECSDWLGGCGSQSQGFGSNNWVLAPQRTETKTALLANDPHLSLLRPAFWYWTHLNSEHLDVIGATFPGVPVVVNGSNRHVSWGVTNAYMPVARLSYVEDKELVDAQSVRPWVWVKVWNFKLPIFFKSFRKTPGNLPILPLPGEPGKAMVLRWSGLDVQGDGLASLYDVMFAKNAKEIDQAFARANVPTWNFVFADDQGNIGYRTVGRVPRFDQAPPFGIPTESLKEVEESRAFMHPLADAEMPHAMNPSRGYIVTANNRQWPKDSRWSSGTAQAQGFRAFRIEELLNSSGKQNLDSTQRLQCDTQAVDARFILPPLMKIVEKHAFKESYKGETEKYSQALALLRSWDYSTAVECRACGIYRRWVDRIYDELGLDAPSLYRALGAPHLLGGVSKGGRRSEEELLETVVAKTFTHALGDLKQQVRDGMPTWGEIHKAPFRHIAVATPSGWDLPRYSALPTGGDEFSVNPGSAKWNGRIYEHNSGASQRLVVLMTQPPQVYSVLAGSNLDENEPNIHATGSSWQNWAQCKVERKNFPLNWEGLATARVNL